MCMYHKDFPLGDIFLKGEEIPDGWVDHPSKANEKKAVKPKTKKAKKEDE